MLKLTIILCSVLIAPTITTSIRNDTTAAPTPTATPTTTAETTTTAAPTPTATPTTTAETTTTAAPTPTATPTTTAETTTTAAPTPTATPTTTTETTTTAAPTPTATPTTTAETTTTAAPTPTATPTTTAETTTTAAPTPTATPTTTAETTTTAAPTTTAETTTTAAPTPTATPTTTTETTTTAAPTTTVTPTTTAAPTTTVTPTTTAETTTTAAPTTIDNDSGNIVTNLYYVYSRPNKQNPVPVLATADSIDASPILNTRLTVILVHGHGGSLHTSLNPEVKNALLDVADINVIVVDWHTYAKLSYPIAVVYVPLVADHLVRFINQLVATNTAKLNELHIVGFGLGAHVAGITGRKLNSTVARITGLDPSRNMWENPNSDRLKPTDAIYVEVIHTDGKSRKGNGIGEESGNVDFFANGGRAQPGCGTNHTCCHERAFKLFAASMINNNLLGYKCATMREMERNRCTGLPLAIGGIRLNKPGYGIYRVNTKRDYPF